MVAGFLSILLIHWTRNSEHDNFATSVAGFPPRSEYRSHSDSQNGKRNPEPGETHNSHSILWKPRNPDNKLIIIDRLNDLNPSQGIRPSTIKHTT